MRVYDDNCASAGVMHLTEYLRRRVVREAIILAAAIFLLSSRAHSFYCAVTARHFPPPMASRCL